MVPTLPFFFVKHSIRVIFSTGSYVFFYVPNMYSHNPQHNPLSVLATLIPHRLPIPSSAPMTTQEDFTPRVTLRSTRQGGSQEVGLVTRTPREWISFRLFKGTHSTHISLESCFFERKTTMVSKYNMHTQDLMRKEKYGVRSDTFFSRLT